MSHGVHRFLIPDPTAFVSGGNRYNAALRQALAAAGVACERVQPQDLTGITWQPEDWLWVDTLYLEQWEPLSIPARQGLLVHHLDRFFSEKMPEQPAPAIAVDEPLAQFDAWLCTSPLARDLLVAGGLPADRVVSVPPGTQLQPQLPLPTMPPLRALIVSNAQPRKGLLPFFQALAEREETLGPLQITVAGQRGFDADYDQAIDAVLAAHPRLRLRVQWVLEPDAEQMGKLYRQHHLLVSAAFFETFGMAIREALACSRPVLVLAGGYAGEQVQAPWHGWTVPDMTALVQRLIGFTQRPETVLDALTRFQGRAYPKRGWAEVAEDFLQKVDAWPAREAFATDWLSTRFPYDQAARHTGLEAAVMAGLPASPRVMDLGCGSGSNLRHLSPRLGPGQSWICVDHNRELLAATRQVAEGLAKVETLDLREADLLQPQQWLTEAEPDLVVANAVFDLFTSGQMATVLAALAGRKLPLYTTLLYTGMHWQPEQPDDTRYIAAYEAHMQRPRAAGAGMGPQAPAVIEAWVTAHGGHCERAPATWEIPAGDRSMQGFLLGFMEQSVPVMLPEAQHATFFAWLTAHRKNPRPLTVHHQDLWITW